MLVKKLEQLLNIIRKAYWSGRAAFFMCWNPFLNIGIGIGQFNHANISTSDICISPGIGHILVI